MSNKESNQLFDVIKSMISNSIYDIHTSTIAKVTAVNEKTINVKCVIATTVDGNVVDIPEMIEVPPVFMGGGSSYTAHPISVGDYCLLVITERCFDNWYVGFDGKVPAEYRVHDYSDAFAIVGLRNEVDAITIPKVITTEGESFHKGDHEHEGNISRKGTLSNEGNVEVDGDTSTTGNNESATYSTGGTAGVSGSFVSYDGKSVTVTNGLITSIV